MSIDRPKYTCNGRLVTISGSYEGHGPDDPSGYYYTYDDEPGSRHWISTASMVVRFALAPRLAHKNMKLHVLLTDEGACVHQHHEADFDDGDPENGPGTGGFPAWDEYTSESHFIVVDGSGLIVHTEAIDWAFVQWCEEMEKLP